MYIYIYGSDQVIAMLPPPPPNYFGEKKGGVGGGGGGKEMCNLFRAWLYFKEDILNQSR